MSRLSRRLSGLVVIPVALRGAPTASMPAPQLPEAVRARLSASYPVQMEG